MEHLDTYEGEGIDEEEDDGMDEEQRFAARQAAEAQLARRDRREGVRTGRALPEALAGRLCSNGGCCGRVFVRTRQAVVVG